MSARRCRGPRCVPSSPRGYDVGSTIDCFDGSTRTFVIQGPLLRDGLLPDRDSRYRPGPLKLAPQAALFISGKHGTVRLSCDVSVVGLRQVPVCNSWSRWNSAPRQSVQVSLACPGFAVLSRLCKIFRMSCTLILHLAGYCIKRRQLLLGTPLSLTLVAPLEAGPSLQILKICPAPLAAQSRSHTL